MGHRSFMKVKLRPQNVFDLILPRFPRIECKQSIPNAGRMFLTQSKYSGVHMFSAKQYGPGRQPCPNFEVIIDVY